MIRVSILVGSHGRGSNMRALATQIASDDRFTVHTVIGSKHEAPALETARNLVLPVSIVPFGQEYSDRLLHALQGSDWICLAGYMKLFPIEVLEVYKGRVLNIHPALLPKFGGRGMYGMNVHEAVIAAKESESGCTVHYVSEEYDEGATICQARCEVTPEDTAETLAEKVLRLEHETYFMALKKVALG